MCVYPLMFRYKSCMENLKGGKGLLNFTRQRDKRVCSVDGSCPSRGAEPSSVLSPRIHISVQIPHQDGMLPLISTMPLHNLHFLLSESIYRHQHVCSNLVTTRDLRGLSGESTSVEQLWRWGSVGRIRHFTVSSLSSMGIFPTSRASTHKEHN